MQGTSRELQDVAMSAILKFPDILSKCLTEVDEGFFDNLSYKLIYKCLKLYYGQYLVMPTKVELALMLKENFKPEYGNLSEAAKTLDSLLRSELSSEEFAFEKVVEFIKRVKSERAISEVIKVVEGSQVNLDQITDTLCEAMTVSFAKHEVFNLADITKLAEIKKDALGDVENPTVIKMFIPDLNYAFTYKGLIPGTLNCVSARPGAGKTMFLVNQGVSVAQQGFKCLHVFLGDMNRWTGLLRYAACMSGVSQTKLAELPVEDIGKLIQKFNVTGFFSNLNILEYAVSELTANQLIEEINKAQLRNHTHYDCIIIDYDENILYEDVDMYKSGGMVYNKLALFARQNKSVVFIASQPKQEYYSYEVLPLEALSESSKKQKIVDLVLTIGKSNKSSVVGTLNVPKNRHGKEGNLYRLAFSGEASRIRHVSESEYHRLKQEEKMEKQQANGSDEFDINS